MIGVPKIIYETLEDILEAQIRRLAIDIAKTLDVNEKLLLQELKKDKIKTDLIEDNSDIQDLRCNAYTKYKNVYVPCDMPIMYKKEFCISHIHDHITKDKIKDAEILSILCIDNSKYYRDIDDRVYNDEFEIIGIYKESTHEILKFVIETSNN
jgi:hypothetical protein